MKKLAIFVEGQTEQLFISKLIKEIAGIKQVAITMEQKIRGQNFITIEAEKITDETKYYVLIRDCRNEDQVKTAIIEVAPIFASLGYEKILGLRDVYPKKHSEIPELRKWKNYRVPTKYLPINIILAVMEVEAWFLAEISHFIKIDPKLTNDMIKTLLGGFDPTVDNVELRYNPAKDLDDIYHYAGFAYTKRKANCMRTVEALDCCSMYISLQKAIPCLGAFILEIDTFLT
jgi:hypothetical protein